MGAMSILQWGSCGRVHWAVAGSLTSLTTDVFLLPHPHVGTDKEARELYRGGS